MTYSTWPLIISTFSHTDWPKKQIINLQLIHFPRLASASMPAPSGWEGPGQRDPPHAFRVGALFIPRCGELLTSIHLSMTLP